MSCVVYWLENEMVDGGLAGEYYEKVSKFQEFPDNDLSAPLKFAEQLRAKRKEGAPISHIDIKSENTDSVGQDGVASAPKDYAWYKRRVDPAIPLGRNSGDDIEVDLSDT